MHLTLRQLKVFEAVARHLSFSRAAAELHLSQPAVSMQVKLLEDAVGLPLFEHLGKKTFLTEAGRELFHSSRSIAAQLVELDQTLAQMKGGQRGKLRVSVASTANYFAPQLLANFSQSRPEVAMSLNVTNRETLLQQLAANELDLAIMGKPPEAEHLQAESFMDNPLVVIAPAQHPFTRKKKLNLEAIRDTPFLMREQGSGTRSAIERFFAAKGLSINTSMEMSSNEAIKQAVQAGLGLGILSLHTLEQELTLKRLAVLKVEGFPIMRHWYIVHRADKRLSPIAQAFKEFVVARAESVLKMPQI